MRCHAALLIVPLAADWGCTSDHDELARRDRDDSGSAGDTAAAAGRAGAPGGGGGAAGSSGARPALPVEPEGDRAITLLHGVVDAVLVRFCFLRAQGDMTLAAVGDPVPASGLGYGESVSLGSLGEIDPLVDDILPIVLAADGSELDGLNCEQALELAQAYASAGAGLGSVAGAAGAAAQAAGMGGAGGAWGEHAWAGAGLGSVAGAAGATAQAAGMGGAGGARGEHAWAGAGSGPVAGAAAQAPGTAGAAGACGAAGAGGAGVPPPPVRAGPLPVIPRRTLAQNSSFLLVARGCLGGGTLHSGPDQDEICGSGYAPTRPTLAPVLVRLSRLSRAGILGLQVVHASSEADELDVRSLANGATRAIATEVVPGAIAPLAPNLEHPARYYGALTPDAMLQVVRHSSSAPVHEQSWQSALASSGLEAVADGQTYTLVVTGPALAANAAGWHHPPHICVVPTDPSTE